MSFPPTAVNCHTSCHGINHDGISDLLAQPEIAPGDDDCRSCGGVDEVDRSQTFGCKALICSSTGGDSSEDNLSNSEAVEGWRSRRQVSAGPVS
jgi:hypothetical protein